MNRERGEVEVKSRIQQTVQMCNVLCNSNNYGRLFKIQQQGALLLVILKGDI